MSPISRPAAALAATLIAAELTLSACASSHPHHAVTAAHASSAPAPTTAAPTTAPPPTAAPDGTYRGSCDYTLGSDPVGGTARAIGEVDLTNTGNVGTVVVVRITWPQEGYGPLVMTRTVRTAPGERKAVRFHRPLSQNQIDLLQSWQDAHNFRDGCTYKASIVKTWGSVQG